MQQPARTGNGILRWRSASVLALALGALALGLPAGAAAQTSDETGRSYAYGSLSHVEGDVWHQRADDFGAHEAEANSPFLPGDRIWTREPGWVEIRLAGRITAWMDEATKLDYVEGDSPHRLGFWTGSLVLAVEGDTEVVVETPGGTLSPQGHGEYRTDLLTDGRTVQFVVHEGIATVSTEWGSVLVGAGQRTVAAEGTAPAPVEAYQDHDQFLAWTEERRNRTVRAADIPYDELPREVREHADDLHEHGRWHRDTHLGWVWYPAVSAGWAPYRLGRWTDTPFGYTWISHDPWGWAPFHYGNWGHGPHGWYWLPGSVWSPAWVSWAYGPSWVGWAPLSYYGNPVYGFWSYGRGQGIRRGTVRGKAVRRGSAVNRQAWSFTRRDAIGRPASRNRLAASSLRNIERARVLSGGAILDRNFRQRAVGAASMTRSAKATTRRLSNARRHGVAGAERSTARAQRVAVPSRAARARTSWTARQSPGRSEGDTGSISGGGTAANRSTQGERAGAADAEKASGRRGTAARRRTGAGPGRRRRAACSFFGRRAARRSSGPNPSFKSWCVGKPGCATAVRHAPRLPAQQTQRNLTQQTQRNLTQQTQRNLTQQTQRRLAQQTQRNLAQQTQRRLAQQTQRRLTQQTQRNLTQQTQRRLAQQTQRRLAQQTQRNLAQQTQRRLAQQTQRRLAQQTQRNLAQQTQRRLRRRASPTERLAASGSSARPPAARGRSGEASGRPESADQLPPVAKPQPVVVYSAPNRYILWCSLGNLLRCRQGATVSEGTISRCKSLLNQRFRIPRPGQENRTGTPAGSSSRAVLPNPASHPTTWWTGKPGMPSSPTSMARRSSPSTGWSSPNRGP